MYVSLLPFVFVFSFLEDAFFMNFSFVALTLLKVNLDKADT